MPLIKTFYGGLCPLDKFGPEASSRGYYNANDPRKACPECSFSDGAENEDTALDAICQCPVSMTPEIHDSLQKSYLETVGEFATKRGFRAFVAVAFKGRG